MDQVLYRREGAVEVVTLNRPESKNSFSFTIIKELGDHFQQLTLDDEVRAVIITGAGKGFCTGADSADRTTVPISFCRWACGLPPNGTDALSVAS